MRSINEFKNIYLYRCFIDFRKSFNGLTAIVQNEMKLDLFWPSLFIFCGKRRKSIKILYWDYTGLALWYKKLETDIFLWPKKNSDEVITVSSKELQWLLDGIDFWHTSRHLEKNYEKYN